MTPNVTAAIALDSTAISPTPRTVGQSQNPGDARLFTEMLENAALPERRLEPSEAVELPLLHRVDLILGELNQSSETSDLSEEQQAAALVAQAGSAETSVAALTQVFGPPTVVPAIPPGDVPTEVPSSRGTATGSSLEEMAHQTVPDLTGSADPPGTGTQKIRMAPRGAGPSALASADQPVQVAGYALHPALPTKTSLLSVRRETHLLAAEGPPAVVGQSALKDQDASNGEIKPRVDDPQPAARVVAYAKSIAPTSNDVETVTAQIAGQVSSAWAWSQGAVLTDNSESQSLPQVAGTLPEVAPDVVKALQFALHPADLGEVHVRLSMSRNGLRLHLNFSADKAAGIAKAEGQELMQAISAGGMNLSQLVIDTVTIGRAEPLVRQDGSSADVAMSAGSMADGNGAGQEHARQEQAQTPSHSRLERYSSKGGTRDGGKAGLFI